MPRLGLRSKICRICRDILPLSDFHLDRRNKRDGRQSMCKSCKKEYADSRLDKKQKYDAIYREKNKERLSVVRKEYMKTDKAKRMHYLSNKKYRKDNPEKYKAHGMVSSAIRSGKLVKENCKCGSLNVHAHHHDYSKPLDVEWLCPTCHKKLHRTVNV